MFATDKLTACRCYSAQEFSSLTPAEKRDGPLASGSSSLSSLTGSAGSQLSSLPLDIVIETIISVALLCVAIVLGSEELKPISWRVWASNVERQKSKRNAIENLGKVQIEGYDWLEDGNRKSFLDVRVSIRQCRISPKWMLRGY